MKKVLLLALCAGLSVNMINAAKELGVIHTPMRPAAPVVTPETEEPVVEPTGFRAGLSKKWDDIRGWGGSTVRRLGEYVPGSTALKYTAAGTLTAAAVAAAGATLFYLYSTGQFERMGDYLKQVPKPQLDDVMAYFGRQKKQKGKLGRFLDFSAREQAAAGAPGAFARWIDYARSERDIGAATPTPQARLKAWWNRPSAPGKSVQQRADMRFFKKHGYRRGQEPGPKRRRRQ